MDKPQPDNPENLLHHIDRLDIEEKRIHTWRVVATRGGVTKAKIFTDSKYGGKDAALQAAICYRDELLAKIDQFAHQIWVRTKVRSNNTSGIPGVGRRDVMANSNPNGRYVSWVAYWIDEHGIGRQRGFSILRHGEQEAKRLAIAEREHQLELVCAAKGSHWCDPLITKNKKL
jgi:hypothetical protein